MNDFFGRHQSKILALATIVGAAGLIWLDEHRHPSLPEGQSAPALSVHLLGKKAAPGFDEKTIGNDAHVTLTTLKGQPAVLDFWATTCPPCRASLPHLSDLSKQYAGRVRFIAVDAEGEDEAAVSEMRDRLKLEMPVAADGEEAAANYRVEMMPTTVVLDREGRIVETHVGVMSMDSLSHTLDGLL